MNQSNAMLLDWAPVLAVGGVLVNISHFKNYNIIPSCKIFIF